MFQKYQLRQDMFLIGPPGTWRRYLVLTFAYLLQKEIEYVPVTADTSETDLKVRREIRNKYECLWYITERLVPSSMLIKLPCVLL